jgi:hypothetical protein
MNIRQAEIATGVPECQSFVIQAHEVQDCGMQVVHVNFTISGKEPVIVGGTM